MAHKFLREDTPPDMAATIQAGDAEVIVGRVTNKNEVLAEDLAEKAEECTSFMGSPVLATGGPAHLEAAGARSRPAAGRDHLRALRAGLRRAQCQTRERRRALRPNRGLLTVADAGKRTEVVRLRPRTRRERSFAVHATVPRASGA